jgi:trimethylamine--corrinoid protein Co-methyltransferase
MVMQPTVLARINFVLHAAGWLEGGLAAGYEKFVMDCELLGMFHKFLQGLDLSEDGMALESIREVPTTGHHLGTEHTMKHFRTAFHRANIFDYNSFEQWRDEGGKTTMELANGRYKQLLRQYEPPDLDPAIDEALQAFITQRKTEIKPEY